LLESQISEIIQVNGTPLDFEFNADGSILYVTNPPKDNLLLYDVADYSILSSIPVGTGPLTMAKLVLPEEFTNATEGATVPTLHEWSIIILILSLNIVGSTVLKRKKKGVISN